MMNARALALVLTLTACGASAGPTPAPAGDAGGDAGGDAAADAFPCGAREAMVGGQCVPASDSRCGTEGRACAAPQRCVVDGAEDGGIVVHCVTL